ncbi:MAG: hypothetical protein PHF86_05680 [Candidatus Nanoarchaeia archaeon]|nr:hypothetical protein [Candidatus Nanoarchaeia archaeon]
MVETLTEKLIREGYETRSRNLPKQEIPGMIEKLINEGIDPAKILIYHVEDFGLYDIPIIDIVDGKEIIVGYNKNAIPNTYFIFVPKQPAPKLNYINSIPKNNLDDTNVLKNPNY